MATSLLITLKQIYIYNKSHIKYAHRYTCCVFEINTMKVDLKLKKYMHIANLNKKMWQSHTPSHNYTVINYGTIKCLY